MTSDLSSPITVVGIQGVPVSTDTPEDGYVITYVAANNEYEPKPLPAPTGLRKDYFTSSGTWTCPEGVTNILVIAAGGGGGASGGPGYSGGGQKGGGGGGGSLQQTGYVTVTPNTTYTITIGAGGTGGAAGSTGNQGSPGSNGGSTSFDTLFSVLGAGKGSSTTGGSNFADGFVNNFFLLPGSAGGVNDNPFNGQPNYINIYSGGTGVVNISGGGGAGPQGAGGNSSSSASSSGASGGNNTGAGGGGGAPNNTGVGLNGGSGSNGGNGGSGYLYIIY